MKRIVYAALFALSLVSILVFAHADGHRHGQKSVHGASFGAPGEEGQVSRTVEVGMDDSMRFTPSAIAVKRGDTVKFIVTNSGHQKHELVLGSANELKEHAKWMRKFPQMEHVDPNMVSVEPGQSGELIWRFTKAGKVNFACLRPGHFEAGMKGIVSVR